jgi:multiple sugar transport system permease protein
MTTVAPVAEAQTERAVKLAPQRARFQRSDRGARRRPRVIVHVALVAFMVYFALPFWWLIVASSKSQATLFDGKTSPLWFGGSFDLFTNINALFTYSNGQYAQWLGNSFIYAILGGVGATVVSVLGGYGLSMYAFRGRRIFFAIVLGSVMIPGTVLAIPLFIMMSGVHLTNTIWSVVLPSMLNPFGVYLMKVFTDEAIPLEMIDAARVDGAGELRIFARVALPLMRPAVVTVLLLGIVGTWNNYYLPLVMISNPNLYPVTVGLGALQAQAQVNTGGQSLWNLVITGALISIIPLIVSFLSLQKYWQGGLSLGSVK